MLEEQFSEKRELANSQIEDNSAQLSVEGPQRSRGSKAKMNAIV